MDIKRSGSQPSSKGPAEWFTGVVRIDPLFEAPEPARVRGASVTFEPGARTAWHTHPLGQTLIVTFGLGWAQRWGDAIEEIRPRRGLVSAGREALAWRNARDGDESHCRPRSAEWKGRRLDGTRDRRAVPQVNNAKEWTKMPHIIVKLWPGKSKQQKARLSEAIAKDVMNVLNYGEESVSVAIKEVEPEDRVEKVYKPDIQNKWEKLYKKPGYELSDL